MDNFLIPPEGSILRSLPRMEKVISDLYLVGLFADKGRLAPGFLVSPSPGTMEKQFRPLPGRGKKKPII